MQLLESELDSEKEERKRTEKRMRAAESAVIEMKNDGILDQHDNVNTLYNFYIILLVDFKVYVYCFNDCILYSTILRLFLGILLFCCI